LGAFFRAIFEKQQKAKHVESIWIPCLDWGSIPHYSTIKQKRGSLASFSLVPKIIRIPHPLYFPQAGKYVTETGIEKMKFSSR